MAKDTTTQPTPSLSKFQKLQAQTYDWCVRAHGHRRHALSKKERVLRILEEVLELCQVEGIAPKQILAQLDYTYTRPTGERSQELAGVMVCLTNYAGVVDLDLEDLLRKELARIDKPEVIEKMQDKVDYKVSRGICTCGPRDSASHLIEAHTEPVTRS